MANAFYVSALTAMMMTTVMEMTTFSAATDKLTSFKHRASGKKWSPVLTIADRLTHPTAEFFKLFLNVF